MKKFLYGLLAAAAIVSPAYAENQVFFNADNVKGWEVKGVYDHDNRNFGSCMAIQRWPDGSFFSIVFPIHDNTWYPYVMIQSMAWKITAAEGIHENSVTVQFDSDKYKPTEGIVNTNVIGDNVVSLEGLSGDFFVDMGKYDKLTLTFILSGMTPDNNVAFIPLEGSTAAMLKAMECVDEGKEDFGN
jgi:hypothetical protein